MKQIIYAKSAQKALLRMPRNWAVRIRDKVNAYAADPTSQANNITALQGSDGLMRMRVGNWRVIFHNGVVLEILDIKSRGSAYRE